MTRPSLFVAVLNWNSGEAAAACVRSVRAAAAGIDARIVVVDNASSDDSLLHVRQLDDAPDILQTGENAGYAGGMRRAVEYWLRSGPETFGLLLTQDVEFRPDALGRLLSTALENPKFGIVGPLICERESTDVFSAGGIVVHGSARVRQLSRPRSTDQPYELDWVDGCALLVRREVAEQFAFDERYFMYFEEVDLCVRAGQAGWRIAVEPRSVVTQSKPELPGPHYFFYNTRNRFLFWEKNYGYGFTRVLGSVMLETAGLAFWCVRGVARPACWSELPLRFQRLGRQVAGAGKGVRAWIRGNSGIMPQ